MATTSSLFEQKFVKEGTVFLKKEFGYKNSMEIPKLKMIVVNTSLKEATSDTKVLDAAANDITAITGQRPVITKAKKSISNFKLRQGQPIGCRVTLRRKRMYEFMNKLVNVALPRVRDFKGIDAKAFDGRGNYTLGLTEQIIFPEINPDKVSKVFGMNITFVTTAKTDKEGKALLKFLGMPFKN
jgi:large subunit ribosomal protein L5